MRRHLFRSPDIDFYDKIRHSLFCDEICCYLATNSVAIFFATGELATPYLQRNLLEIFLFSTNSVANTAPRFTPFLVVKEYKLYENVTKEKMSAKENTNKKYIHQINHPLRKEREQITYSTILEFAMNNNFIETRADIWSTLDDDYANYIPTNSRDIHELTILPTSRILGPRVIPLGNRSSSYYPWQITGGRLTDPSGLASLSRDTLDSYQRPLSMQASPNIPNYGQDSRMTQEEQKNVLKKLRKEVYNPPPKNTFRRLCLYYRDHNNIVKERVKDNDEDGKRCAVCLEDFEPRETVMLTPCNHMFHEDCIVPWVKSHGKCPVCGHQLHDPA